MKYKGHEKDLRKIADTYMFLLCSQEEFVNQGIN